jgi:outer membrane protein assembly factor BamB
MHTSRTSSSNPRRVPFGRTVLAAGLLSLPVLAGCETVLGPGHARSPEARRADFPINHDAYRKVGYRLDWVGYPVVSSRERIENLYVDSDLACTIDSGSTVSLLSASNGSVRWTNQLADKLTNFVGLDRVENRIYASAEGELFVLDQETGTIRNRQRYPKIVSTPPVVYGHLLVYGTGSGEIFAHMVLNAVEGVRAWGNTVTGAVEAAPVLVGSAVGVVTQSGRVLFMDAASGTPLGANQIYGGLATNPVAGEHVMYVAGLDQSVWAFNAEGGSVLWRHRTSTPLRQQPTLNAGTLYCGIDGTGLVAFDAGTGAIRWTAKDLRGTVIGTNRGRLVVWDGSTMTLVDPARGDVIEHAALPKTRMLKPDKFDDGNLYVVSLSGVLAKFAPR